MIYVLISFSIISLVAIFIFALVYILIKKKKVKNKDLKRIVPAVSTKLCVACSKYSISDSKFCQHCGKSFISTVTVKTPSIPVSNDFQLESAAKKVFNDYYLDLGGDPEDVLWKRDILASIYLLEDGGKASVAAIENLLMECAIGNGTSIAQSWWYGGKYAVKTAVIASELEAESMLIRILQKDSKLYEWFTYIQKEAALQLQKIGTADCVSALQQLLSRPFSMSPISDITKAIELAGGKTKQTPAIILQHAESTRDDQQAFDYLWTFMDDVKKWEKKDIGWYYYLLGGCAKRLGHIPAAKAFYAAQINACPRETSMGWQIFTADGVTPSTVNATKLHQQYPLPKNKEEVIEYIEPTLEVDVKPHTESDPYKMTISQLINFLASDAALETDFNKLSSRLAAMLEDNFYSSDSEIERALRIFGDMGMVSRYNSIKASMNPYEIGLLFTGVLKNYFMRKC